MRPASGIRAPARSLRLVTSQTGLQELAKAREPKRDLALRMVKGLPLLNPSPRVEEVVGVYVARKLIPREPLADATHLAPASVHGCQYRVPWNCMHLANALKVPHIRVVNESLGLAVPVLATPEQMLGGAPHVPAV